MLGYQIETSQSIKREKRKRGRDCWGSGCEAMVPPSGQVHGAATVSCREKAVESWEQSASLSERIKDSGGGGVGALSEQPGVVVVHSTKLQGS